MRLIDADALEEHLAKCVSNRKAKVEASNDYETHEYHLGKMSGYVNAKRIVADAPTIEPSEMQWIYVDDEYPNGNLPNIGEPVLLCCEIYLKNPKVSVCYYMEIGTYEWDGEQNTGMWFVGDKQVYVSHWMPLPKFPEGYGR